MAVQLTSVFALPGSEPHFPTNLRVPMWSFALGPKQQMARQDVWSQDCIQEIMGLNSFWLRC